MRQKRRKPTEHRIRVRRYARLFSRGFGAIALCVLVGLYALLVLWQDMFGVPPRNRYLFRNPREELSYRIHQVIVETWLRLARAAGMTETLIRITLAVIMAAAFGTAIGIGWVLWYRQPVRETAAKGAGVEAE
jgi:ABC-type nitrate/sulfonate/bicarbonate transport system permease component